jgi:hypothetical protein
MVDEASAHCDTMDGPVVKAAQKALATGNVNLVLIWVRKQDEAEIKKTFQKTLAVRKLNAEAKELADLHFFETVVRIHRAGEGEPYTGLKPEGTGVGPVVSRADNAIESGKLDSLLKLLVETLQAEVREAFKEVIGRKKFKPDDVAAGREYVEHYVRFLHRVERIFSAAKAEPEGHPGEGEDRAAPEQEKC